MAPGLLVLLVIMTKQRLRSREAGFTLLEVIVVMVVVGIIVLLSAPSLMNMIYRSKVQDLTRRTSTMLQVARIESVRLGVPTVVRVDPTASEVFSFVDNDGNSLFGAGDEELSREPFPAGISNRAPDGEVPIDGLTSVASWNWGVAIFLPNGSVRNIGGFRFTDQVENVEEEAEANWLEVRVEPLATARVVVRKWNFTDSAWREQGEDGENWKWEM